MAHMDIKVDANELVRELADKLSELTVQNTILEIQNKKLKEEMLRVNTPEEAQPEEPDLSSEITE